MNDLQHDLYQENILDHAHNPMNYEPTPSALRAAPRGEPLNSKRPWGRGTNANAFGAEVLPLREDLGGG